jgi:Putative zinc-finger
MLCDEAKDSLSAYIDDSLTLPLRVAVDEHMDRCPVCRAELSELRALTRQLRNLERPQPPAELTPTINDALMIEMEAARQTPFRPFAIRLALWLEPKLMPYTVGSFASVILFIGMFAGLRPHFVALRQAAAMQNATIVSVSPYTYDLNQPVTPEMFSAKRAPFAEQSPTLNPVGALAALTGSYLHTRGAHLEDADDMIVVADVFSNGAASLAGVVQPPRNRQMLTEFETALRRDAAFVPASMDRRPDTMRVVFAVQKVDVHERNF